MHPTRQCLGVRRSAKSASSPLSRLHANRRSIGFTRLKFSVARLVEQIPPKPIRFVPTPRFQAAQKLRKTGFHSHRGLGIQVAKQKSEAPRTSSCMSHGCFHVAAARCHGRQGGVGSRRRRQMSAAASDFTYATRTQQRGNKLSRLLQTHYNYDNNESDHLYHARRHDAAAIVD